MIFTGLDMGQAKDFCALACVDRKPLDPPLPKRRWRYEVRWLQSWPLGTAYPVIADGVAALYARPQLAGSFLVPDYTGVGRPVFDMLKARRVAARLYPVLTHGGRAVSQDKDTGAWHVPKAELVSTLQVLLQAGLIAIEPKLKLTERLAKELQDFRVRITRAANETFGAEASQHDDLCLPADVPVLTARGWVAISQVTTADEVLTRDGWKAVDWAGMTSPAADTIAIECGNAGVLECTLRHPVFVPTRGWVAAADIRPGDEVLTCPQWSKRSSGADGCGGGIRSPRGGATVCTTSATPSGRLLPSTFTGRCGEPRSATSPTATTFTTATTIRSTTTSRTWSALPSPSTAGGILLCTERPSGWPTFGGYSREGWPLWPSGESPPPGRSSFAHSGNSSLPTSRSASSDARRAGRRSEHGRRAGSIAASCAASGCESTRPGTRAPVPTAAPSSWPPSGPSGFAPARVRRVRGSRRGVPVFNLTVADCPEFFAGGILVHNCFAVMLACWLGERDGAGLAQDIGFPPPGEGVLADQAPPGVFHR